MDGCTCEDPDLIMVKDMNLAQPYKSGNAYSRYCRTCERRYFCSDSYFDQAEQKYVIPKGKDEPIKAEDYDGDNFFECPECDRPHFGYPDGCDCGAEYEWPEEAKQDA